MTTSDNLVSRTFRYILSFGVLISLNAATIAYASPSLCSEAPSIGLDETHRGESLSVGGPECFRLETPAAGLLMLDLAVPGTATAEPRLSLLGPSCERSARMDVIEQSTAHVLTLSDEPRQLTVCVGAQDPRHVLGEYKLHTAFVEIDESSAQRAEQVEVDPDPFSGCAQKAEQVEVDPDPFSGCAQKAEQVEVDPDPFSGCAQKAEQVEVDPDPFSGCAQKAEQVEVDPDPFSGCAQKAEQVEVDPDPFSGCAQKAEQVEVDPDPFSGCAQKAEQVEVDPDPFSGCAQKAEQVEVDPDPFSGCAQRAEQVEVDPDPVSGLDVLTALCRAYDLDDHADNLLCATPIELGRSTHGEIDNGWGDDYDVFVFELTAAQTVGIETSSEIGTLGELYDRKGQRLASAADGGNSRLVKTLQAGIYFVRVEGEARSQGSYALTVGTVEHSW